jgi:hypothetical protein
MQRGERIARGLLTGALLLTLGACGGGGADWVVPSPPAEQTGEQVRISGVVRRSELEGGLFVIRGSDSVTYEPTNLPPEFRKAGLAVEAVARRRDDLAGIHQVGPIVDLERIRTAQ